MARTQFFIAALTGAALSAGVALPAFSQGQPSSTQPTQDQPSQSQPSGAPAADQPAAQHQGAGQDQPAKTDDQSAKPPQAAAATDPNLQVATVRLEGGYRASKVVGAAVYNAQNQQIGTVDDIILNHQNQADLVVLSVGGFLGVGGKLVALPYGKIERTDNGKVMLEDATKDQLAKMPSFTYAQ